MSVGKILFVIGSLDIGGAELQMTMLVRELARRGIRCEVFSLNVSGPLRGVLQADGIVVHDGGYATNASRWMKFAQLARALFRLFALSWRSKPDVLHAYLPLTNFLGALVGRAAGVRRIITSRRALGTHQDRYPYWKRVDRISNRLSHCITANSQAVVDDTVRRDGTSPKKIRLVYNGIDFPRLADAAARRGAVRDELGLLPHERGVVSVGNLLSYKGHADLLEAVPGILRNHPGAKFFFVGEDRGMGPTLSAMAVANGSANRVVLLGYRDDIPDILAAMDLFVMPSHEEGFSNALLEAMASGLPIVATDVGGNREALANGDFGLLVPPHAPPALREAICRLLNDEELSGRFGGMAKDHVHRNFSVAKMIDDFLALYEG
ncbi:glycosyltransferase [Oleispirillum naphthae]|uniref:glycosyltransferase n=1 Tax=Oleispirillum naphthae TaxID=2838853 RepID=UPI0030825196